MEYKEIIAKLDNLREQKTIVLNHATHPNNDKLPADIKADIELTLAKSLDKLNLELIEVMHEICGYADNDRIMRNVVAVRPFNIMMGHLVANNVHSIEMSNGMLLNYEQFMEYYNEIYEPGEMDTYSAADIRIRINEDIDSTIAEINMIKYFDIHLLLDHEVKNLNMERDGREYVNFKKLVNKLNANLNNY
ncbi:hypothetical protein MA9V1_116 [Chryseobacterium phage MA9V-1]|nr:hypothetical protein MA9V1_116 [Chryseobacterium phage MA9V-1]